MGDFRYYGPDEGMSESEIENLKRIMEYKNNQVFKHYGSVEDMSSEDLRLTQAMLEEIQRSNSEKAVFKHYGSIEDMSSEDIRILGAIADEKRKEDAPIKEAISNLVKNGLPNNYEELKEFINSFNVREDFVKYLLEQEKEKVYSIIEPVRGNYTEEANNMFKGAVFEYLAVINALIDLDANHLTRDGDDSYYVDLGLTGTDEYLNRVSIIDQANQREKHGCNMEMPIPRGFDKENQQISAKIREIIQCMNLSINKQYADAKYMWKKIGYEARDEEKGHTR